MKRAVYWIVALLNAAALAAYTARMPQDIVPVHFNYRGVADSYGSKWTVMIAAALPIVLLLAYEIYRRVTRNDERVRDNRPVEDLVIPVVALFFGAVGWLCALSAAATDPARPARLFSLIISLVGALIVYIGNYMGKVRPNRTFGVRTRSTLADDVVWVKTHRVSAISATIGGLIAIAGGIIGYATASPFPVPLITLLIAILLTAALPAAYAMNLYNKRHAPGKA